MSSQSFPLLNLPCLALVQVFKTFGVKELVSLSLASSQAKLIVKHYRNKSLALNMELIRDFDPTVFLREKDCYFNSVSAIVKPFPATQPDELQGFHCDGDEYATYWNNEVRGTKFLLDYFCDLFGITVKEVTIEGNEIWMLDLVEKLKSSSYKANVWGLKLSDDEFRHILLNLNPTSSDLDCFPSGNFEIKNFHKKYDAFHLSRGTWITMDNLLQLDCKELRIKEKDFTSQEMKRYIRHVLTGGANRLRHFCAGVENGDAVFALLEATPELSTGEEERNENDAGWEMITKVMRKDGMVKISIKYYLCYGMIGLTVEQCAE